MFFFPTEMGVSGLHTLHEMLSVLSVNCPRSHQLQRVFPFDGWNVPGRQIWHSHSTRAPKIDSSIAFPCSQRVHFAWPGSVWYFPGVHAVQVSSSRLTPFRNESCMVAFVALSSKTLPLTHCMHLKFLFCKGVYIPELHTWHWLLQLGGSIEAL